MVTWSWFYLLYRFNQWSQISGSVKSQILLVMVSTRANAPDWSKSLIMPYLQSNVSQEQFIIPVKPLNSGHLMVSKNLSVIEKCPLLGGNLRKIVTFGTKFFVRYSRHVRSLGCTLLGGFTVSWTSLFWTFTVSKHIAVLAIVILAIAQYIVIK